MSDVFTVPERSGAQGPDGPASPAQEYGGIYIAGTFLSGNPTQALVTGAWNKAANFQANMPSSGVTPQFALNQVTIVTTGHYFVYANVSYSYGPLGTMRLSVFVNGVITLVLVSGAKTFGFTPSMTDANNVLIGLTAGDVLDIRLIPSAAASVRIDSAQLYVERANP